MNGWFNDLGRNGAGGGWGGVGDLQERIEDTTVAQRTNMHKDAIPVNMAPPLDGATSMEDIKDDDKVYLVNKKEHVERLQWIVKDYGKVVLLPEKIPKDFELCFRNKKVVVVGGEGVVDNIPIDSLSKQSSSLKRVELRLLYFAKNFDKSRMEGDRGLSRRMYRSTLFDSLADSTDIVRTRLDRVLPEMALSINDLNMLELPARKPLLHPWIYEGDLILISGNAGVGKSWFSMEICSAIQNGRSAFNGLWNNIEESEESEKEKEYVKALYVDGEMHWNDIIRMVKQLGCNETGILSKTLLDYKDVVPTLNLNDEVIRTLLYDLIIKSGYKFVVLDNLFSLWSGVDLDSAKEWHPTNQWLLRLRAKGVTVCLLHHTNKSGVQMGSQSKLFNINTALILKKAKQQLDDDGEEIASFHIEVEKMRSKGKG